MNNYLAVKVIAVIALAMIGTTTMIAVQSMYGSEGFHIHINPFVKAPITISGDNSYVAWWTNDTGNDEVMFRASTDGGQTFGDKINLSNTTDSDSTRVEIDSDADSVVVTWWETNQTDDTPVMRVSNDNGATFGPVLTLATNETIGEAAEEEDGED
jgi:hypothetical protein